VWIRHEGHNKHLGSFDHAQEQEAAKAYDEAARKLLGERAQLNFPAEGEQQGVGGARVGPSRCMQEDVSDPEVAQLIAAGGYTTEDVRNMWRVSYTRKISEEGARQTMCALKT
jgi:hypothetical protein